MGIDYYAFKIKPETNISVLKQHIDAQALHIQSNPHLWNCPYSGELAYISDYLNHLHFKPAIAATEAIRSLIEFEETPEGNINSYRVGAIERCGFIFPFAWRVDALRTLLPEEVASFFDKRRLWVEEVKAGKHRELLAGHYCLQVYRVLRSTHFLETVKMWFSEPRSKRHLADDFFQRAMLFPISYSEPHITMDISKQSGRNIDIIEQVDYYRQQVALFVDLLSEWNQNSSGKWKVQEDLKRYKDLDTYISHYDYSWFNDLYNWAMQAAKNRSGLALSF